MIAVITSSANGFNVVAHWFVSVSILVLSLGLSPNLTGSYLGAMWTILAENIAV